MFLVPRSPRYGCYEITTSSFHGMVGLNSYIDAIRTTAGRISYIPLKLRLVPRTIAPEGKKKTVHVLEISYEGTMEQLAAYKNSEKVLPPMPSVSLPTREELENDLPRDLVPHEGVDLDKAVFIEASDSMEPTETEVAAAPQEPIPSQAEPAAETKTEPRKPTRRI